MGVTCRVALRLEQRIEVPEGAFHPLGCGHLLEAHFQQHGTELCADLEQWVQMPTTDLFSASNKVQGLELGLLPITTETGKQEHKR